ncbi:hypothetical protein SAMN04488057_102300 [Cyclobacterium lianum]|uniref:Uncharacterized protein n=1 Tax=Cyclobacterium lianum TaxID=388280 RepID=A0A1M7K530_9BACT|nr:hypothetical protein SAMN04488057_102300 [Cyclobacterium lianum]
MHNENFNRVDFICLQFFLYGHILSRALRPDVCTDFLMIDHHPGLMPPSYPVSSDDPCANRATVFTDTSLYNAKEDPSLPAFELMNG